MRISGLSNLAAIKAKGYKENAHGLAPKAAQEATARAMDTASLKEAWLRADASPTRSIDPQTNLTIHVIGDELRKHRGFDPLGGPILGKVRNAPLRVGGELEPIGLPLLPIVLALGAAAALFFITRE